MKQFYFFLAFSLTTLAGFSQGSIIMKLNGVTIAAGEKIIAYEDNATAPVSSTGTAGKVAFDNIKIKKPQSLSSYLIRYLCSGTHISTGEFDFMDASNNLIYKIELTELTVTKVSNLAPECPTLIIMKKKL